MHPDQADQIVKMFQKDRALGPDDAKAPDFFKMLCAHYQFEKIKQDEKPVFIVVLHMVHTVPYFLAALARLGEVVVIIPKAAYYVKEVESYLKKQYEVYIPSNINKEVLKNQETKETVQKFLIGISKKYAGKKIIGLDHGAYLAIHLELLNQLPNFCGIVEHTGNGDDKYNVALKALRGKKPLIYSIAGTELKQYETDYVASCIVAALKAEVCGGRGWNQDILPLNLGFIGFGHLNRAIARILRADKDDIQSEAKMNIFDISESVCQAATEDEFVVCSDKKQLLRDSKMIICATRIGFALTRADFAQMQPGTCVVCVTSSDDQFAPDALDDFDVDVTTTDKPITIYRHKKTGKTIYLAYNGTSVNFPIGSTPNSIMHAIFAAVCVSVIYLIEHTKKLPERGESEIQQIPLDVQGEIIKIYEENFGPIPHRVPQSRSEKNLALLKKINTTLRINYRNKDKIVAPCGKKPLLLSSQYINLGLLDKEKETTEKEEKTFLDNRLRTYESLPPVSELMSVKQLLAPYKNKLVSHIVWIEGRAGIGKTILSEYVTKKWAEGRLWPQYKYVFLLCCRDLSGAPFLEGGDHTLGNWIFHTLYDGQFGKEEFLVLWRDYIESQPQLCLFVIDGDDELPQASPYQKALQELYRDEKKQKIITSRPHSLDSLPENRRHVEVVGFTDDNVMDYIDFYFDDIKKANEIIAILRANPVLWGSAHIPLLLNIICGVIERMNPEELTAKLIVQHLGTMSGLYQHMEQMFFERDYCKNNPEGEKQLKCLNAEEKASVVMSSAEITKQCCILAHLAFEAFNQDKLIISFDSVKQVLQSNGIHRKDFHMVTTKLLALGFLKALLNKTNSDVVAYEFLHLTSQEYYAAQHIIAIFKNKDAEKIKNLRKLRFNPRYQVVWWFVSGGLKDDQETWFQFMQFLQESLAEDLFGNYSLGLLVRCVEEAWELANKISIFESVLKLVRKHLLGYFTLNRKGLLPNNFNSPLLVALRMSVRWMELKIDLVPDVATQDQALLVQFFGEINFLPNQALAILQEVLVPAYSYKVQPLRRLGSGMSMVRLAAIRAIPYLNIPLLTNLLLSNLAALWVVECLAVRIQIRLGIGRWIGTSVAGMKLVSDSFMTLLSHESPEIRADAARGVDFLGKLNWTPALLNRLQELSCDEHPSVVTWVKKELKVCVSEKKPACVASSSVLERRETARRQTDIRPAVCKKIAQLLSGEITIDELRRLENVCILNNISISNHEAIREAIEREGAKKIDEVFRQLLSLLEGAETACAVPRIIITEETKKTPSSKSAPPPPMPPRIPVTCYAAAKAIGKIGAQHYAEMVSESFLRSVEKTGRSRYSHVMRLIEYLDSMLATPKVLDYLLILLDKMQRESGDRVIPGPASLTMSFGTDDNVRPLLNAIIKLSSMLLDQKKTEFLLLPAVIISCYLKGWTQFFVQWESEQCVLQVINDNKLDSIVLTSKQAQILRSVMPDVIHSIQQTNFFKVKTLLENAAKQEETLAAVARSPLPKADVVKACVEIGLLAAPVDPSKKLESDTKQLTTNSYTIILKK